MNKFERLLIKLLLKILSWPIIRELHSEAQDKFNETIWKNDSEMAKRAAKEMQEFLAKQDSNYLEKLNKEAKDIMSLVPLDKQRPNGVIKVLVLDNGTTRLIDELEFLNNKWNNFVESKLNENRDSNKAK